ncbi:MAG: hypothetical protein JW816_03695 [Candidatus Buchananbacteria bacterium]|nr:hypothetical protein [Candidatus Buchananbacteria bacterium]
MEKDNHSRGILAEVTENVKILLYFFDKLCDIDGIPSGGYSAMIRKVLRSFFSFRVRFVNVFLPLCLCIIASMFIYGFMFNVLEPRGASKAEMYESIENGRRMATSEIITKWQVGDVIWRTSRPVWEIQSISVIEKKQVSFSFTARYESVSGRSMTVEYPFSLGCGEEVSLAKGEEVITFTLLECSGGRFTISPIVSRPRS